MTTIDFITELFFRVDEQMTNQSRHSQAKLAPSEIVTLALLFSLKGASQRHFYRWLRRDFLPLFPNLPERTRLFRLFRTHRELANWFLAEPTVLGVTDSFAIEFCHPARENCAFRKENAWARKASTIRGGLSAANSVWC